jgi:FkbM family methyltransferase
MRSQNNEEQIILNYFGNHTGTLLDIGANDGYTLSNSYNLMSRGWQGCLVEPAPGAWAKLEDLYLDVPGAFLFNYAIGARNGKAILYESGEHLGKGDTGLLSTIVATEMNRWKDTNNTFVETEVRVSTFSDFLIESPLKHFDLITIDAEGMDYEILRQIDLQAVKCRMLIIEFNGKHAQKYIDYMQGYRLVASNYENLIFAL